MHYFLDGAIKQIGEVQEFGNFKKREFIVKTEEQFPEIIKLEFINENVDALDTFSVNEVVTVAFVVKGNEYQGKFYNNLRAIAICERVDGRVEKEMAKAKKENKRVQQLLESAKLKKQ
jgi:hypothetical protein